MMGNVVVWKPAYTQIYSAQVIMEVFIAAGLPAGVINLIFVDGPAAGEVNSGQLIVLVSAVALAVTVVMMKSLTALLARQRRHTQRRFT